MKSGYQPLINDQRVFIYNLKKTRAVEIKPKGYGEDDLQSLSSDEEPDDDVTSISGSISLNKQLTGTILDSKEFLESLSFDHTDYTVYKYGPNNVQRFTGDILKAQ